MKEVEKIGENDLLDIMRGGGVYKKKLIDNCLVLIERKGLL
jgi:hypothetical protein